MEVEYIKIYRNQDLVIHEEFIYAKHSLKGEDTRGQCQLNLSRRHIHIQQSCGKISRA